MNSVTIYTTIFGDNGYILREPLYKSPDADYVCFTDNKHLASKTFKIVVLNPLLPGDPDRSSKYIRLFVNEFISTKYAVYLDATMLLKANPGNLIQKYLNRNTSLALYKNHLRKNISEEKDFLVNEKRKSELILTKQIQNYKSQGFTDDAGLFFTGFMVRKTFDKRLTDFNRIWWQEILKYTSRIEMSLPFVLWKTGFKLGQIQEGNAYTNKFYDYLR